MADMSRWRVQHPDGTITEPEPHTNGHAKGRAVPRTPYVVGESRFTSLTDFLDVEDEPAAYRIDELMTVDGRVLCAAQFKAGKTITVMNLLRSFADGDLFLGRFQVDPVKVALIDDEMDDRMLRRWLRKQGILRTDNVALTTLKGRLRTFDIMDAEVRAEWAEDIASTGCELVILDCVRPILDSLGLDEGRDAGRFLVALDELLYEAGVEEAIVIHHAGHTGERARGDSRLRDWPTQEWRIVRQQPKDGSEPDPSAPRYFTAYGREVDVPEQRLQYDDMTGHLTLDGGSRKHEEMSDLMQKVVAYVKAHPKCSQQELDHASIGSRDPVRDATLMAAECGEIRRYKEGNRWVHEAN